MGSEPAAASSVAAKTELGCRPWTWCSGRRPECPTVVRGSRLSPSAAFKRSASADAVNPATVPLDAPPAHPRVRTVDANQHSLVGCCGGARTLVQAMEVLGDTAGGQ